MIIRNLLNKFLKRNKNFIESNNVILEMNGVILSKSNNKDFDFKSNVIEEVQQYCRENGINKVDKVIIISVYDADIHHRQQKLLFQQRTISNSESRIVIIKEKNKTIAQVFFSEFIEIEGDN